MSLHSVVAYVNWHGPNGNVVIRHKTFVIPLIAIRSHPIETHNAQLHPYKYVLAGVPVEKCFNLIFVILLIVHYRQFDSDRSSRARSLTNMIINCEFWLCD